MEQKEANRDISEENSWPKLYKYTVLPKESYGLIYTVRLWLDQAHLGKEKHFSVSTDMLFLTYNNKKNTKNKILVA